VQDPSKHTSPVPHGVPFATLLIWEHDGDPAAHDVTPVWQTLSPGLHGAPPAHATHAPLLHT
jgi:hypothetical protein